jgi:hypothetical protein
MNRSMTKWLNPLTGMSDASSHHRPLSTHRLTEQERHGILAKIQNQNKSHGNP